MEIYRGENNKIVGNYWETYIKEGRPLPQKLDAIRPEILDSWRRSVSYGISPFEPDQKFLASDQLKQKLKDHEELIAVTHAHLQKLYFYVKGTNFAMVLADHDGYIIDMLADDALIRQKAHQSGLKIGCLRSEKNAGTSGISICLMLDKPYAVYGKEHFLKANQDYICCAAPIHSQDKKLLGCLALIGPCELAPAHSLGMITAAADGIEKELSLKMALNHLSAVNTNLHLTLNSLSHGILLVNRQGEILQHNDKLKDLFSIHNEKNPLQLIELLEDQALTDEILNTHESVYNHEITIPRTLNPSLSLLLNISAPEDVPDHLLLTFDKPQAIRRLVSKTAGFLAKCTFDSMIGNSLCMKQVKKLGHLAAKTDSNLLILGESGTGKDILAQAVHNESRRCNGPFLPINCAALPKNLIESELFGYEGGTFTGAQKGGAPGKFELAEGGTIFLDEIGDMPLELQATLLRVLQNKEIIRVGGKQPKPINVRIIAATNTNLEEAVLNKEFRSDLYYRLNVLSIVIPPLRYRKEDISPLIDYFTRSHTSGEFHMNFFSSRDRRLLTEHSWPGNVRELENIVERVIISSSDGSISSSEILKLFLNLEPSGQASNPAGKPAPSKSAVKAPEPVKRDHPPQDSIPDKLSPARERALIVQILTEEHGHVASASLRLAMPRRTLYRKIQKYHIDLDEFRG
ncbi:(S)-limonene 6-monooxygenase [uncultured Roseburia sp.]|uniref:Sigma 54-interacting transcriptional regulator n=1 Tax=Brotonthovivens ammoniilytica TaxID=2981725 RepID=A0ABT2TLB2_9FIRM|nr:sigma 54-interacting transcriptional regulator [Brotonthovivens ammoniilytica]MCU6762994.1 sigma 54-interacting transcriptional regulator [Brotonthovivens ammoniilytica]SCI99812.1 (S)-limonene 6-monooxygenase [uncultured Roseburia sp.]